MNCSYWRSPLVCGEVSFWLVWRRVPVSRCWQSNLLTSEYIRILSLPEHFLFLSLLESLVFAGRAAEEITRQKAGAPVKCQRHMFSAESLLPYQDEEALAAGYKKTILNEIERLNNYV